MSRRRFLGTLAAGALLSSCRTPEPTPLGTITAAPKVALALGGGAAKGFAHIGVIKSLETHNIVPDFIVGTSAGSVVGALYAAGMNAFELQKLALELEESTFTDWAVFDQGILKSQTIERFINKELKNTPIEKLKRRLGVVATALATGKSVTFVSGDTGLAVRASSSVPGVFSPTVISGKEYVDGGLVSPIPVLSARKMGADIVIAVDISSRPSGKSNQSTLDLLLDTFSIMGSAIAAYELAEADIVIQPDIKGLASGSFEQKNLAILRGEEAAYAAIASIKQKIASFRG